MDGVCGIKENLTDNLENNTWCCENITNISNMLTAPSQGSNIKEAICILLE